MQTKTKTETKKTQSIASQQELKTLKKAINDGHKTIELLATKTIEQASQAVTEGILEGERLLRAKKLVPYGGFNRWIKENCKSISLRTAQRYMTLATRKAHLLKTDLGLRQAYALVGIIRDDAIDTLNPETISTVATDQAHHTTNQLLDVKPVTSLAAKAAQKARALPTIKPVIQTGDPLSRAKFLAVELLNELNSKLIINLIVKDDARQIVQPIIALVQPTP